MRYFCVQPVSQPAVRNLVEILNQSSDQARSEHTTRKVEFPDSRNFSKLVQGVYFQKTYGVLKIGVLKM